MKQNLLKVLLIVLPFLTQAQSSVDKYGKLKLVGLQLSSECGNPVQLRGLSSFGPQWNENCYNSASLDAIANDWKSDIFRLAMYVHEGGYLTDTTRWKNWIDNMVDEVGKRGMYCMIDWHILGNGSGDGDPMAYINEARAFWRYMSKKHAGKKHVIYEICNEPNERDKYGASANEKDVNWPRIKQYAEIIIPLIRANDPETIIIVGTPYWSNRPWRVVGNPLTGANAKNTMYTYHYYAGTPQHNKNLDTVKTILDKIPVFATEWGLSEESGTGFVDVASAQNFADVLGGKNPAGIKVSWCAWSFVDKDESSALLKPYSCQNATWNNRSTAGAKTFDIINNPAKDSTTCFPEPKITRQPQNIVGKTNEKTTLSVIAAGDKLKYQWQKSTDRIVWTDVVNATSSSLIFASVTASSKGYYRVKVSNYLGYLFSQKAYLSIYADGPYFGLPIDLPGKIEAENYDIGGQNKSYFDNSTGNTGGAYRTDDVDIQGVTDSLGGYGIGYWATDEWLDFSVNVLATAKYDFYFRIGSANDNTKFKILLNGVTIIPQVNVPNVGSWSKLVSVSIKGIDLTKGTKKIRIQALSDGFNLNYFEVKGPKIDCNNDINGTAIIDACGYCAGGNTGIAPKTANDKCYVVTGNEMEVIDFEKLNIYPNPFHDKLYIQSSSPAHIDFFDLNGKKVFEQETNSNSELSIPETLPNGMYQLKISTSSKVEIRKVLKR